MFRPLLIAGLLVLPATVPAQAPWTPPIGVAWPLADIALGGDTLNGIHLVAMPAPGAKEGRKQNKWIEFGLSARTIRVWLPAARRLVDRAPSAVREIDTRPTGVRLPGDSIGTALLLGMDPTQPIASRLFLQLVDSVQKRSWSVRSTPAEMAQLLAAFDSVLLTPAHERPVQPRDPTEPPCEAEVPKLKKRPPMTVPTDRPGGGRVILQFVVDTNGVPDDSTVRILLTSGPSYTAVARQALAVARYSPGQCETKKLRVLVQQGFYLER